MSERRINKSYKMSRDRWLRILRIVAVLATTVGCAQQSADEPSPIADGAAAATSDETILDDGNAKPDVELASAESSVPEVNEEDPSSLNSTIKEITLRDANIAMEMIARYFPIRDMQLEYVGVLSNSERGVRFEGGPHPSSEHSYWVLTRAATDEFRTTILFDLLAAPRSEYDIPLQAGIDRVVYVHLKRCSDGTLGIAPCEEFKINGVEVVELFRRCDEEAMWHWDNEKRELQAWQRINARELARAGASEFHAPTSSVDLAGGIDTSTVPGSISDSSGLSSPIPVLRQLAFRRFIGSSFDEMIAELELSGPCLGPGVPYGSMRGGVTYRVSPQFPDNYFEIYYARREEGTVVRTIRLLARDPS